MLPGGLDGYTIVDVSADGLKLLLNGGAVNEARILLATRPSTSSVWTDVESIPTLSFNTTHLGASWGVQDGEIYLAGTYAPPTGVGDRDILVSALQ